MDDLGQARFKNLNDAYCGQLDNGIYGIPKSAHSTSCLLLKSVSSVDLDDVKGSTLGEYAENLPNITEELRYCANYLLQVAHAAHRAVALPVAGDWMLASEAAIRLTVPRHGKLLVYSNGAACDHHAATCQRIGVQHHRMRIAPWQPLCVAELARALSYDASITHVMMAQCEFSTGMLNPVAEIAELCERKNKKLLVDAALSFGAVPLDLREMPCEAVIVDSDKSLHGPFGLAWIIVNRSDHLAAEGLACLQPDSLENQRQGSEPQHSDQFDLPAGLIRAFSHALREHRRRGGQMARLERYLRNRGTLVAGLRALNLETFLPSRHAAPMLGVFIAPDLPLYSFPSFAQKLTQYGFRISSYAAVLPGTFAIGCMADLDDEHMTAAVTAIERVLRHMGGPPPLGI
jgi:2-aminoethylphosphonate-pyruvate transaminase